MSYSNLFYGNLREICFFILTILHAPSYSQIFKGKVLDYKTGEALEYANIGVVGKNVGGITLKNGEFSINLSMADAQDVVRVSYIGYESVSMVIKTLNLDKDHTIRLPPKILQLDPVVVSEKADTHLLGNQKVGRTFTGWGDFKSLRGRTRGLLIDGIECSVKVKAFFFRINHNDWDSVAFRLNFMNVENDKAGQSILHKNIFFTTNQRHKWVRIDLTSDNVIICSKTIVTLEWVDAWGKVGEYSNMLTLSLSKDSGHSYLREPGEEAGFLQQNEHAPAMYIEVYGD